MVFAPIIQLSPILTPGKTHTLSPIQTLFPIIIEPFEYKLRSMGGI